ncbi:MAG: hypothetical protein Q7V56_10515 [Gammaproteobacteria bacterium]|nr:hypothetical protein [Gammaproteobacteria bacterium]
MKNPLLTLPPLLTRYFLIIAPAHLLWEFLHLPLYTLWDTGSVGEILFAIVHCTGGDLLIAAGALALAIIVFGQRQWSERHFLRVAIAATVFGLLYTMFSEWLNVDIRRSWAYKESMPLVPLLGTGLTPALQWLMVPALGFWFARKAK